MMPFSKVAVLTSFILGLSVSAYGADENWASVGEALGKTGAVMAGGVYRVGLPRTDLKVTLDGVEIKPGLLLGAGLPSRHPAPWAW
jgi:hypothetical protein